LRPKSLKRMAGLASKKIIQGWLVTNLIVCRLT
jgi:hypothetical protein